MDANPKLENWSVIPPKRLHGFVYGHPSYQDGTEIETGIIHGRRRESVVTRSGNIYDLGEPNPDYAKACFGFPKGDLLSSLPEL